MKRSTATEDIRLRMLRTIDSLPPRTRARLDAILQQSEEHDWAESDQLGVPDVGPHTLVQLCFALEKLRSRRFVPALILALRTGSESLRAAAAQALGGVGGQRALAALSVSVREDPDAAAREAAAYALRWFDGEAATAVLVTVLNDSLEVPRVRATAAESCNHYGPSAAMPHLIRALRDQSPEVRFWAAFALGQMGAAEALEELERLIATDTAVVEGWWSVKKEAADAKRAIVERIGDSHMT